MEIYSPNLSRQEVNRMGVLALAHVGDAVYELLVRTRLCAQGPCAVNELHKLTVAKVNAPAQARAAALIQLALSEDELAVYRRGRNAKVNSVPHSADIAEYHAATGLETLFGWLFLQGMSERVNALFELIKEADDAT